MSETIVETALGALIVALTDETVHTMRDRQEIDNIVAYLLTDLVHNKSGRFRAKNFDAIKSMNDACDALSWQ
jgi:hypothetical protein